MYLFLPLETGNVLYFSETQSLDSSAEHQSWSDKINQNNRTGSFRACLLAATSTAMCIAASSCNEVHRTSLKAVDTIGNYSK